MGREGHYIITPKRLDEGLHHQNSLKSVLEREGEISSLNGVHCTCFMLHII